MSGKPLFVSDETLQRALELRAKNIPVRQISKVVGISRERLRKLLLAAGCPSGVPISLNLETYDHLDPVWLAEFRGFFFGEGCASVGVQPTGFRRKQYQPRLAVSVREDDAEVIVDIYNHLGGNVKRLCRETRSNYTNTKPYAVWQLVGFSKLTNLLPLLANGTLQAKKRKDLQLLNGMCQARLQMPYNLSDEHSAIMARYYEALRSIKRFQGTDG